MTSQLQRLDEASVRAESLPVGTDEWKEACADVARVGAEVAAQLAETNPALAAIAGQTAEMYAMIANGGISREALQALARDAAAYGAANEDAAAVAQGAEDLRDLLANSS
jgi:hypothetical protein